MCGGEWTENLGGFKVDISMRHVWPRLNTSDAVVCAQTNVFNCLCNAPGLWLATAVAAAAALLPSLCGLQVARMSRSRLQP